MSTLAKVVFRIESARLYSLTNVRVGATTRNHCVHASMLLFIEINPGRVANVADVSSGHRRTPSLSVGQNS